MVHGRLGGLSVHVPEEEEVQCVLLGLGGKGAQADVEVTVRAFPHLQQNALYVITHS